MSLQVRYTGWQSKIQLLNVEFSKETLRQKAEICCVDTTHGLLEIPKWIFWYIKFFRGLGFDSLGKTEKTFSVGFEFETLE